MLDTAYFPCSDANTLGGFLTPYRSACSIGLDLSGGKCEIMSKLGIFDRDLYLEHH